MIIAAPRPVKKEVAVTLALLFHVQVPSYNLGPTVGYP